MEGPDAHLATPFFGKVSARRRPEKGLYHGGVEQGNQDVYPQEKISHRPSNSPDDSCFLLSFVHSWSLIVVISALYR
jgi:hypothetical protein